MLFLGDVYSDTKMAFYNLFIVITMAWLYIFHSLEGGIASAIASFAWRENITEFKIWTC